jgi:ketol-acid reductoisomerase
MATNPAFFVTPKNASAQVTAANTARDGTGTIVTVLTADATGTKVHEVVVEATGTTTAGIVRLFLNDGTNTRLFDEVLVTAITPSATVATFRTARTYDNLVLPNTWSLRASTHNAETFNVIAFGASA